MRILSGLVKTVVGVALTPVAAVADSCGAFLITEGNVPLTVRALKLAVRGLEEIVED